MISETEVDVTEGSTATYTVRLNSLPSANVTVTLTSGNTAEATISDETLTFTTTNGTTNQTVRVTGVDDDDADNEATAILHRVSIGDNNFVAAVVPVSVTDDDAPGLTLASTHTVATLPSDVSVGYFYDGLFGADGDNPFNEAGTATYTIQLAGEPEGDTTIRLSTSNSSALTVSPTSITFTKTGDASDPNKHEWDDAQTVTLTAESDSDGADDLATVYHRATIGGRSYMLAQVRALISDLSLPKLTFSPENREVTIASEGGTATYTIKMSTEPDSNVTVNLASSDTDSVTVSPSTITFTKTGDAFGDDEYEWDDAQTVTVTGVADDDEFDDIAFIRHRTTFDNVLLAWPSVQVTVTDGNRAPSFEDGNTTTREVREDAGQGDNVGDPITATDLNAGDILTYTLDDPSGKFAIDSTGQITVVADDSLDYETTQDYSMEVSVAETSANPLTDKIEVKILVLDVNEPPTVSGDTELTYPEDSTRVLERYTATDPERDPITWSVEGTDKDSFTIDSSGNLRFSGEQDFETDDELDITIVATDDADPPEKGELEVTVTLTDVDDPPEITGSESLTFSENTSDTTVLATYSAHDPEGVTSSFTWSLSGADSRDFDLSTNGELTFKNAPNFEGAADSGRNNEYNVNIRANDGSLSGTLAVTITVNDVNEAPTISGDASLSFAENTAVTRVLDKYSATDPERSSITWTLGGTDPGAFTIDSDGDLHFDSEPDFENPTDLGENNVYEIQVVAEDDGNLGDGTTSTEGTLSASFDVTVTVTPVNEPPTVSGQASHSVNENVEDFSRSYTASDPEGSASTFTWSLSGTDGGDFSIDRNKGILTFRNAPNYESPVDGNRDNEYLVQVRASDGQYTGTLDVTIDVDDVNEPPTITGSATPPDFPENSVRSVATYRATDPERSTINWSLGGDDSGDFNISGAGVLTFASIPDFENPADDDRDNEYLVQVRASDGTNTAPLDVTVNVINSTGTEEPTITTTSNPSPYQENGTGTVYTFRATDPQRGTLTWSLLGTDAGDFTITRDNSGRGVLSFNSPPDFENPADANRDNVYEIGVLVTDEQGLTDGVDVTITVTNHHESLEPDITTRPSSGLTYHRLTSPENRTSTVYTYSARNYGTGSLSWSVSGTDAGDFDITTDNSGRGLLTFRSAPDFESPADSDGGNDYEITMVVTNTGGYADRLDVVVTITDVAEAPTISTRPSSGLSYHNLTYPENRTSTVYTYSASDPQRGAISWSVTGTDANDFTITGDSSGRGVLTFSSQPDYENSSDSDQDRVYELTVVATDEQGLTDELDVRVTVTDVNEGPEISRQGSASGSVPENQAQDTVLARYTATDPEGGTVSRWRTSGLDGGDFVMNEQGELRFRSVPDYERPADSNLDNIYEFTVQVSDGRNYGSFDETLTVTPVNEPPTITTTSRTEFTQPENRASRLYTWRATDPEGGSTIRWSLGGTDSRFFTINERGEFSFAPASPPDFEQPGDSGGNNVYNVAIQVSDDSSPPNTASLPVTVTVTDANEEPEVTGGGDSFIVQENRDWAGTTFTARDPEDGTVTRWALGGRDGGDFQISNVGVDDLPEDTGL